jgi:general secretion pathway protein G
MAKAIGKKAQTGFTLIEIMIVVTLIGVLCVLAIPSLQRARETSRSHRARNDVRILGHAVEMLAWDTSQWPGGASADSATSPETWDLRGGDAGLVTNDGRFTGWSGPYTDVVPIDPWGSMYFFDPDYVVNAVNRVVVGSFGPNGVGQNLYDDDIVFFMD